MGNHTLAIRPSAGQVLFSSVIPGGHHEPGADEHETDDQVPVLGVAGQQPDVVGYDDQSPTSRNVVIATPNHNGLGGAFFGGGGV